MAQDPTTSELHARAVSEIGIRNCVRLPGRTLQLACLIREADMRPLPSGLIPGKQASLLGVDCEGNFILRGADGSVILRDRATASEEPIASSVRRFLQKIETGA